MSEELKPCPICSHEEDGEHYEDCRFHPLAELQEQLLPCPFCGCHARYYEENGMITCAHQKHGCGFYYSCEDGLTPEHVAFWNRRPTSAEVEAALQTQAGQYQMLNKSLCDKILTALAGVGICTPAETYDSKIGWAVEDIIKAIKKQAAEAEGLRAENDKLKDRIELGRRGEV